MRFLRIIFTTLILLLAIVFIVENLEMLRQTVTLNLDLHVTKMETPEVPLWVMVLFCFFLGVFTTALYGIYEVLVQRQTIRQLKRNLEILAQELKSASARAGEAAAAPPGSKAGSPGE
ncbi:MAG: lipopolysaccharide assembly protein LapA domain-containing protein [Desulfobaccales bacterium]